MAGSLTWRTYIADNGDRFSVSINKSIAEALFTSVIGFGGAQLLFPPREGNYPPLPRGYRMRLLNLHSPLPDLPPKRLNIRVPFGNVEIVRELGGSLPKIQFFTGVYATGTYYDIASYQGEFRVINLRSLLVVSAGSA